MYEIEKNVPKPDRKMNGWHKYPLEGMEVGDSFFVPCDEGETPELTRNRLRTAITHAVKSPRRPSLKDHRYSINQYSQTNDAGLTVPGARVWRDQ